MAEILTPGACPHCWEEFVDRVTEALAGPVAVAEAAGDQGKVIAAALRACGRYVHVGGTEWEPAGDGAAFAASRAVLSAMGHWDVEGTIAFFREHGGRCDCTVMLNVAATYEAAEEE
jgi:hypothetical protein